MNLISPRKPNSKLEKEGFLKKIFFKFISRERGREEEKERNIDVQNRLVVSCTPLTGDLARNPGRCPDWESNQ